MTGLHYQFNGWYSTYYLQQYQARVNNEVFDGPVGLTDAEGDFLNAATRRKPDKLARFRMSMKVHKTPFMFRPIVACAGTWMNDWSRWLDYQLQRCKPFITTFVHDGQQVLDEVLLLKIPSNCRIWTADANSMYNNIDTEHAIEVISIWLLVLAPQIGDDFPVEAIIAAMKIIMRNNIFEWGNLCFLQLLGTAMGTSAAVMWATIYFGYHEQHTLIPKYGQYLLYFKRYIDDIIGISVFDDSSTWEEFKAEVDNFGILTWEFEEPSTEVNFLDMTLSIVGDHIESRTYQKKMNLYLYIPPSSGHSSSIIKGTIFGLMSRYYAQNTHRRDYIYFVKLLFQRLLNRGWNRETILPIFLEAANKIETRNKSPSQPTTTSTRTTPDDTLFVHWQYHPHDIQRPQIRQLFQEHCSSTLKAIGKERTIVCYSRLKNIGEYVTQAKLHEPADFSAQSIMGEHRDELDSS